MHFVGEGQRLLVRQVTERVRYFKNNFKTDLHKFEVEPLANLSIFVAFFLMDKPYVTHPEPSQNSRCCVEVPVPLYLSEINGTSCI